ncbi:MAG: hypothetical protein GX927_08595 [Lentisphaerae bacterium]|jgi:hypothetical protein|nr:hypothetical protein [Lentisphaerota bacterium]
MKQNNEFKLPPVNVMPKVDPEAPRYGYNCNPLENRQNLEWIGKLPKPSSLAVKQSIIGIGYETLDRDTFDTSLTFGPMAASGVKWARLQSGWMKCEKEKGVYDFAWLDKDVDALLAIGIQPWLSVSFGNPLYTPVEGYETWAEDHPGEEVPHHVRGYVGEVPMYHGPKAVKGWENYLNAMAKHFAGRVTHYEIWNEPNSAPYSFWQTHGRYADLDRSEFEAACARDYVELVKISSRVIRKADPSAKIIGGSLSLTLDACFYVRNLVTHGIIEHIDIFSFHPYGDNPDFGLVERYGNIRHELDSHGGAHIAIWQGEAGRQALDLRSQYAQAKYVTRRYVADFRIGCAMSSYYLVIDKRGYAKGNVCGKGILECDGKPKLAYQALQSMGWLFDSAERAEDLYIRINSFGTPLMSNLRLTSMVTSKFRRKGIPVFSWHVPEKPEMSIEPGQIDVQLWIEKDEQLANPVLIDPIRGNVYRIKEVDSRTHGFRFKPIGFDENVAGFVTLYNLPFTDYPLFITDQASL